MARKRKTRDCWRFYVNYGTGWEFENIEYTRADMVENRRAYRENCAWPVLIKRGRERIEPDESAAAAAANVANEKTAERIGRELSAASYPPREFGR